MQIAYMYSNAYQWNETTTDTNDFRLTNGILFIKHVFTV